MFVTFWVLKDVSSPVVKDIERQSSAKQWNKRILLELVIKNGNCALALWTDALPLLGVLDSDIECRLLCAKSHRCDTKSARQQSLSYFEKSLRNKLDIRFKVTLLIDISVLVHHVFAGNADFVVLKCRVIYTIQAHLDAHIINCHTGERLHILVSDWNQKGIDALIFALDDCLAENERVVCVFEAV